MHRSTKKQSQPQKVRNALPKKKKQNKNADPNTDSRKAVSKQEKETILTNVNSTNLVRKWIKSLKQIGNKIRFKKLKQVVGLLVMLQVQQSLQLRSSHPMHGVVDEINENTGPYIGLVMTFSTEELVLIDSTFFVPRSEIPWGYSLSLSLFSFFFWTCRRWLLTRIALVEIWKCFV